MSLNETYSKLRTTFAVSDEYTKELRVLFLEYESIQRRYEEPKDAMKMKDKAIDLIESCSPDYKKALQYMRLAVKIMRVCNGIKR